MRIFLNTFPHSGTHLVSKCLDTLGFEPAMEYRGLRRRLCVAAVNHKTRFPVISNEEENYYVASSFAPWVVLGQGQMIRKLDTIKEGQYLISHGCMTQWLNDYLFSNGWLVLGIYRKPQSFSSSMVEHIATRHSHPFYKSLACFESHFDKMRAVLGDLPGLYQNYFSARDQYLDGWTSGDPKLLRFESFFNRDGSFDAGPVMFELAEFTKQLNPAVFSEDALNSIYGQSNVFRGAGLYGWKQKLSDDEVIYINSLVKRVDGP